MAKKRANGEGNIRKRKDGRWEGRYTAGYDPETGKAIYKNVLGRTQAETRAKLKAAIEKTKSLDVTKAGKYTVGAWMDEWFENYAKVKVRPSSHQTYRGYIDNHIKPSIGKIPLEKLTSLELQKLYKKLLEKGRVDRPSTNDLVGHGKRLRWIMGHMENCCLQLSKDLRHFGAHFNAQLDIQVAQRFIQQDDGRRHDESSGDRHPLLLPTGQFRRILVHQAVEVEQIHHFLQVLLLFLSGGFSELQAVQDISLAAWGHRAKSWNTIFRSLFSMGTILLGEVTSTPFSRTCPLLMGRIPAMMFKSVDFPQPEGPSTEMISPFWTSRETPFRTSFFP